MYSENTKEIQQLINHYFEGIFYGDVSKLETCFHENAFIYGDIKGVEYLKDNKDYVDGVRNRKSPNELHEPFQMKTIGIEILGNIAMVKLHVPMLGYNYYDYISLVKFENGWKIVNKIFKHV